MSMFTTKSASPLYRMNGNVSELHFASPAKEAGDVDNDVSVGGAFCRDDNIDQCIANINQVRCMLVVAAHCIAEVAA